MKFNVDKEDRKKSGYRGVSFAKDRGKWSAYCSVRGKRISIGYFETAEEANAHRLEFLDLLEQMSS